MAVAGVRNLWLEIMGAGDNERGKTPSNLVWCLDRTLLEGNFVPLKNNTANVRQKERFDV